MQYYTSIQELIGNTPLVQLQRMSKGIEALMLVKIECFNPGHSIKDRIALQLIEDAEKKGILKPGGTIVEATSGNTGMGLALIAAIRGYKCIFTISEKQSKEKVHMLKALGAEVVVCPADVPHDDERSYCAVAAKISKETPGAFFPYQYDNPLNTQTHYEHTGPEIWKATDGKVSHYVAGLGTGGTACGVSKFLKAQNAQVTTIGIDPIGSIFKTYKETKTFKPEDIQPHYNEGIGSDFVPKNIDIDLVDVVVEVGDKEAAYTARTLARQEGIFTGWSSGAIVHGGLRYAKEHLRKGDVMVLVLPDHGSRYAQKIYNNAWMKQQGW